MATDEAGCEGQEVPLGAGRGEDVGGADAEAIADERELVHERDVEVALGVLDDLGSLSDHDAGGPVDTGWDDALVGRGDTLKRRLILAGDDLGDLRERVLAVAWVDALRRVRRG